MPIITPATPTLPAAPDGPAEPVAADVAAPGLHIAVSDAPGGETPVTSLVAPSPERPLRRLAPSEPAGLPSAELLATLVEPAPVAFVPEPERDLPPPVPAHAPKLMPSDSGPAPAGSSSSPADGIVVVPARPSLLFRRRPRRRVRRVTRVVRHIDTWSVFKVALVFNVVLYVVGLTAGVMLWNVAYTTGTIDNIEKFFEQFGWSKFEFHGGEIFHGAWIAGLFVIIGLTGFAVLLATLFNLITDLVGGIRVSVLEEEVVARLPSGEVVVKRRGNRPGRAVRRRAALRALEDHVDAAAPVAATDGPSDAAGTSTGL